MPKIILRTKKLTVGANSNRKTYRIRAYCKAKTGHIWRGDQGKVVQTVRIPDMWGRKGGGGLRVFLFSI